MADPGAGLAAAGSALGPDWSEGLEIRGNANVNTHRCNTAALSTVYTLQCLQSTQSGP